MKYISLFSGIEAASVAWEPLGWEPVAFSEIDKFPRALLAKRFPGVPNLGDITTIDWNKYAGTVDVVVGGSPCQSFSIAGKREGLSGQSGLMFEYIRAIRELRPRYFVWENVPGALSSEGGAAFGQLLSEMDDIGYGLAWRVLDAQFFGVAQRRRRVFLVGCFGDARRAAEILFEPESLRWDYPSSRDKRQELAGAAWAGAGSYCIQGSMIGRSDTACPQGCGINDNVAFTLNTADRHAISYALNCRNQQVDENISDTILSKANGEYSLNYINPVFLAFQQNTRDEVRLINGDGDIAGALAANAGAKQHNYICMTQYGDEMAGTLTTRHDSSPCADRGQNVVCMASSHTNAEIMEDCCTTQTARQYKDAPIVVHTDDDAKAVYHDGSYWVVRRLMPIECERLQGFPSVVELEFDDMTRDEIIACALASKDIEVDVDSGKVYTHRGPGGMRLDEPREIGNTIANGYKVANLTANGQKKQVRINRVIYIAAYGAIPDGYVIDHINNDKSDNRISNLQAITPEDNSTKAKLDGCYLCGNDNPRSKIDVELKPVIFHEYMDGNATYRELAQKYGISKSRVHQIVHEYDWTKIPWRGKPAEECPDGPRYKALGNSMAVPVMRWIGERIASVDSTRDRSGDGR